MPKKKPSKTSKATGPRTKKAAKRKAEPEAAAPAPEPVLQKSLTVPQRIAAMMGTNVYTAGELIEALGSAGEQFKSGNLRGYISTTLNSADQSVQGSDGSLLKFPDGRLLKVHMFKSVARGQYRVATSEDIREEVMKLLEGGRPAKQLPSSPPPTVKISRRKAPNVTDNGPERAYALGEALQALIRGVVQEEVRIILKSELAAILRSGIGG